MDELLGKKVPFSAQAEQAVIGSMLIDPNCIPSVMEKLHADEFYGKLNRDIYETVYNMFAYGVTVDPVTVLDQMKVRGVYQDNCEQYLAEVMRMTPTAANVSEYAAIVRDRALLRRLGEAADEINSIVYEGSGEAEAALEAAERKIYGLRQGRNVGGLVPVSSVVQTVFDKMSEAAGSGSKFPGISTGLLRPEASGSPSSIFTQVIPLTNPVSSPQISVGLVSRRKFMPSSLAWCTSSALAGISASLLR